MSDGKQFAATHSVALTNVRLWFALSATQIKLPPTYWDFPLLADSIFICNDGILLQGHTVLQPRIR